ncbi:MAG: DsbA family protein [Gammaproteobacteria bacterium]|nr:DsbA family protein [Gammaproteobacteria bacterium]
MMNKQPILWYFADPMCSWCWGFSPVFEKLHAQYSDRINIALMLGGLRPGTTESITSNLRDEILHHWHEVHSMSSQPFSFDNAMPEGFIYDTEPASRAVITMAELDASNIFPYFRSIQSAFYVDQLDVTKEENLAELARQYEIEPDTFLAFYNSDKARQRTQQHFQGTQQAGVRGFPSLVLQKESTYEFIARGYRTYDEIVPLIEGMLGA